MSGLLVTDVTVGDRPGRAVHVEAGRISWLGAAVDAPAADRVLDGAGALGDASHAAEGDARLAHRAAAILDSGADLGWGPRLGWRWWRLAAGVLLGLCIGTKWSGLYFLAVFGTSSVLGPVLGGLLAGFSPAMVAQAAGGHPNLVLNPAVPVLLLLSATPTSTLGPQSARRSWQTPQGASTRSCARSALRLTQIEATTRLSWV